VKKKTLIRLVATVAVMTLPQLAQAQTQPEYVETVHGWVSLHSGPKLSSPTVGRLLLGDKAQLVTKANSWWYEVQWNGKQEYITTNAKYTKLVSGTATTSTTSSTTTTSSTSTTSGTTTTTGTTPSWQTQADKVIAAAKTQLGAPYYWGHQVPIGSVPAGQPYGFDCSNFVAWSYRTGIGISFSGSSYTQRYSVGTPVLLDQIRAGDLLFFKTSNNATGSGHVGIYMGNGMVIQEGGGWGKATIESLSGTWLGRNLVFARRVIS